MKRSTSLLLSTLMISTVVFETAFAVTKTLASNKQQSSDQMKIKLVKAKNVQAPIKKTTATKTGNLVVSTKAAPKFAATSLTNGTSNKTPSTMVTPTAAVAPTTTTTETASTGAKSTTTAKSTEPAPSFVSFNATLGISHYAGAEAPKTGPRSANTYFDVWPAITIGPVKTTALITYAQNNADSKKNDWVDPQLFFASAKPIAAGEYLNIIPSSFINIPLSKTSKDSTQLKYGIGIGSAFALNTKTMGWDGVGLNYTLSYLKNETEFSTSVAGEPLTSSRIRQRINFALPISSSFTFRSRLQLDSNFSFENVIRSSFLHFEQIEYKFLTKYTVYTGHTNSGGTLAGDNYENNVKFYNDTSSLLYLGMSADF